MNTATAPAGPRTRRISLPGVLITLVVVLTVVLLGARSLDTARTGALDPENSRANGARALSQVLGDLGVDVTVTRGRSALDDADITPTTTLVVTSSAELGPSTLDHLHAVARDAHVVHVDPTVLVAEHLASPTSPWSLPVTASLPAGCAGPYAGLSLAVTEAMVVGEEGCFGTELGPVLAEPLDDVTFFGAGQALQNGRITDGDNAAVALRLLGGGDRLVWYVPDSTDLDADETTGATGLLPPWTGPVLWLLLLAGLTLALWRGRRLGPLAAEPLPVVVHAVETTVGRGRLLRRGRDRVHAAAVLRTSARATLAEQLQVAPGDLRTLVAAAAARTGRTTDDLTALLAPDSPTPHDDAALVRLGQQLTALTEEVRHG